MNRPGHNARKGARFLSASVAVVALVLFSGSDAKAQASSDSVALPSVRLRLPGAVHFPAIPPERRDLSRSPGSFDDAGTAISRRTSVPAFSAAPARSHRSTSHKVLGGVIGAVAGFFAGAYLGAAIEGHGCACDDPGLQGAMIGAPIGAVAGAIVGVKLF